MKSEAEVKKRIFRVQRENTGYHGWKETPILNIKKGDSFKIDEMGPQSFYIALSDGYLNKDGIGQIDCEEF